MQRRTSAIAVIGLALVLGCGQSSLSPSPTASGPNASGPTSSSPAVVDSPDPSPSPRPDPKHEVYGYVPYWEMDAEIARHIGETRLTTLGLFSVTNTSKGAIDTRQNGYRRITGDVGTAMIRAARQRDMRVELVFTSFGRPRNAKFFADLELQDATIASLVKLTDELGLDGINADVELLDAELVPAYGAFVRRLREAVLSADPDDQVSVATTANVDGAAMARAAAEAGADRIFLMGYDYHWAGSAPGASSPLDRRDGSEKDLGWSLDLYEAAGVPVDRTLLGLPLYGMTWPVVGPEIGAAQTGRGDAWFPRRNLDVLSDSSIVPKRDEVEVVEFYAFTGKGTYVDAVPSPASGSADPARNWQAIYVDSPATLTPKLDLANERGLAGAGFWAIGYERGVPGYTELIGRFAAGEEME